MSDQEFVALLDERMKEIARGVFQAIVGDVTSFACFSDEAPTRLREQLALIKAKEHATVKEATRLLERGVHHFIISALLGHSAPATGFGYASRITRLCPRYVGRNVSRGAEPGAASPTATEFGSWQNRGK
jgi:hypothetical protein